MNEARPTLDFTLSRAIAHSATIPATTYRLPSCHRQRPVLSVSTAMSADQAARHASLLEAAPSGSATMRRAPAAASGVPFVAQARPSMSTSPTEVDWDR